MEGQVFYDKENFASKLSQIEADGAANFHVISDFDRTISRPERPGVGGVFSTIGVIEKSDLVSEQYRNLAKELFEKYYPIEICHEKTLEEKIPFMLEWYEKSHQAMLAEKLTKEKLTEAVLKSNIAIRDGITEFLDILKSLNIPLLIFSAGIASVIEIILKKKYGLSVSNELFHIIGNWLTFDENGNHIGFSKPLVHMFGKNESHTKGHSYEKQIEDRKNVLLIGDGMGDIHMADGMNHNVVLKVGFLNHNVENLLEKYKEIYDIVIIGEVTDFGFINKEILSKIK